MTLEDLNLLSLWTVLQSIEIKDQFRLREIQENQLTAKINLIESQNPSYNYKDKNYKCQNYRGQNPNFKAKEKNFKRKSKPRFQN